MTTFKTGSIAETVVAADLAKRGYDVLLPLGVTPYWDLVFTRDGGSTFERVQVKSAKSIDGKLRAKAYSTSNTATKQEVRKYTSLQVDWLAVYEPDLDECYYVKMTEFDGIKSPVIYLRTSPTGNGQVKGIRMASAYQSLGSDG